MMSRILDVLQTVGIAGMITFLIGVIWWIVVRWRGGDF